MRPKQARYESTPKGRETKKRYVSSPKGRRTTLVYDRTARYSLGVDRFLREQEDQLATEQAD